MAKPELQLSWSKEAEKDLLSIWRYSADEWSPAAADQVLDDIRITCEMLLGYPEMGRSRDELSPGIRSIVSDPNVLFYRLSKSAIEIVRVLHQREDIEFAFR